MNAPLRVTTLAILTGLCGACAASAPPPCPAPQVSQAGWQAFSEDIFRYRLPPGFRLTHPAVVDSWLRRYVSADGRAVLMLEYGGRASNPAVERRGRACAEVIGGRRAQLFTGRMPRNTQTGSHYVAFVVWEDVEPDLTLNIWAEAPDPERLRLLLAAVRTVRFQLPR